jgi:hypothetical protein
MTILVAGGDSFIWGSELSDQNEDIGNFSRLTYPALLARQYDFDYECSAWPSNANNAISRMTMSKCQQLKSNNEKFSVLITWTFSQRFEFRFNYDTMQRISPWYSINQWTIADNTKSILQSFINNNKAVETHQTRNIETARSTGIADFAKTFYKHVGNSEYYELYSTLKEIVFMQNYLENNNISYLFTTADWQEENYNRSSDTFLEDLYTQINWNNWYFFPPGDRNQPDQTNSPRGFYQWAVENKYKIGTTHPLEEAHLDASILMREKFDEMVKKSL